MISQLNRTEKLVRILSWLNLDFMRMRARQDILGTYINNHADSGQRGSKVLSMRRSDGHRYTPGIQAAKECSD